MTSRPTYRKVRVKLEALAPRELDVEVTTEVVRDWCRRVGMKVVEVCCVDEGEAE